MAILSKGTDFTTGDQVTAAKLDALVDNATFASGAVDGVSTDLSNGKIIVKDGGITSAKLASELTGKVKITNNDTAFPANLDGGLLQLSTDNASHRVSIDSNELLCNEDFTIRTFNGKTITLGQVNSAGDGSDARLTINSIGRVGIGTTNPTHELEVNGDIFLNNGTSDGAQLVLASAGNNTMQIDNNAGNFRVVNNTAGTELFIVTAAGNIRIPNIPTSSDGSGLASGTIYSASGTLKIAP